MEPTLGLIIAFGITLVIVAYVVWYEGTHWDVV